MACASLEEQSVLRLVLLHQSRESPFSDFGLERADDKGMIFILFWVVNCCASLAVCAKLA